MLFNTDSQQRSVGQFKIKNSSLSISQEKEPDTLQQFNSDK